MLQKIFYWKYLVFNTFLLSHFNFSQELNCKVFVNYSLVNQTESNVFNDLEKNINVFFTSELFFKQILTASENQNIYRENEYFIQVKQDKFICVTLTVSPLQNNKNFLIEFLPMDQHLKVAKEERMILQQQANTQLLRNLAHEIRNPLGGLREIGRAHV